MADQLTLVTPTRPQPAAARPHLPAPTTLDASGLSRDLVMQLILKMLYFSGEMRGADLAKRLGVVFGVLEPSLDFLRNQRQLEVTGGDIVGGSSYRYRITTEGRAVASMFLEQNHYVGVAPVPLKQYAAYMTSLRPESRPHVTRARVLTAFSHLVLSDSVIDEIGPAINSGHSLFIYGPPGNGKTRIAQGIRGLLAGDVAVPHALEIEGNIIRIFDPVTHQERSPAVAAEGSSHEIALDVTLDHRWAICERPLVTVGGELELEAFELTLDPKLGYYRAPLQLVANGGVLIVDDFGRQKCPPHTLLNRWMVPLESGVDYLTLRSGLKFAVPFQVFVAFATNLKPSELVDEAFLRRVQYKVFAANPTDEQFIKIFENECRERGLNVDRRLPEGLLANFYNTHPVTPRACHPRDIITHALLLAKYCEEAYQLTPQLLETACTSYFVDDRN